MRATAIWMRTAFSDLPTNFVILSVCFIRRKNNSILQRAVEIGDLLGGRVEIVGHQAQGFAAFGPDHDLAHGVLHRVPAVHRLSGRQKSGPVDEQRRSGRKRQVARAVQRRVGLEARHQAQPRRRAPKEPKS